MASAHGAHDEVCAACESTSLIPHTFRTTILRVANLCCVQEDLMIRSTLAGIKGIDNVNVNVVGKYVIIHHCPVACCAPTSMLLDKLNEKRLGVTIREVASSDEEVEALSLSNCYERLIDLDVLQLALVSVLFFVGVGIEYQSGDSVQSTTSVAVYLCAIILGLVPIAYESLKKLLVRGVTDIKFLMVIASVGSVVLDDFMDSALVVVLFLMSEVIERYVKQYVAKAVEQTGGGIPRTATLVDANRTVPTSALEVGDVLLVKTGEIICTDGVVVEGTGTADESGLTGEPIAIEKSIHSTVLSGSILQSGYLHVRISVLPQDSSMQKINAAVTEMQANKGAIAKVVDQFAAYWTPIAVLAAVLIVVVPGVLLSDDFNKWMHKALVVLVLSCPCALVISSSVPAVCAIATAARRGVLIKGTTIVEKVNYLNMVAVDKTGTLTKGEFRVQQVYNVARDIFGDSRLAAPTKYEDEDELLDVFNAIECAVALEEKSNHPLAAAIIESYCGCISESQNYALPEVKNIKVLEGVGLEGWVNINSGKFKLETVSAYEREQDELAAKSGRKNTKKCTVKLREDFRPVIIGNRRVLEGQGGKAQISKAEKKKYDDFCEANSGSVILIVAVDDTVQAFISLSDVIREDAAATLEQFRAIGLGDITMITGDNTAVAKAVSKTLNITNYYAEMLPKDKLEFINYYQGRDQSTRPAVPTQHTSVWTMMRKMLRPVPLVVASAIDGKCCPHFKHMHEVCLPEWKSAPESRHGEPCQCDSLVEEGLAEPLLAPSEHERDNGHDRCSGSHASDPTPVVAAEPSHDHGHDHSHDHNHSSHGANESHAVTETSPAVPVGGSNSRREGQISHSWLGSVMGVFGLSLSPDRTEAEEDAEEPFNNKICFIGDGINDALGLAAAHVGVAIGANGAALAATAGDIVILNDYLNNIPMTLDLCHVAYTVILQNCIFAVGIKLIAVLFAVLGQLTLWAAILIDLGSLLVVILNGMRLLTSDAYEPKKRSLLDRSYTALSTDSSVGAGALEAVAVPGAAPGPGL